MCQSAQLATAVCVPDLAGLELIELSGTAVVHSCDDYSLTRNRCQVIFVTDVEAPVTVNFPLWLRQELDDREWTPMEFSRRLGVGHGTISMWLSGKRHPNPKSIKLVADALVIDEDVAMIAAGHKSPDPYLDPDNPTARLSPLIEKIDWTSRPGRLEEMENELRFMVEADRKNRFRKS